MTKPNWKLPLFLAARSIIIDRRPRDSAPNDQAGIDFEATLIALGVGHRYFALLAMRANVGVEQDFAIVAQRGTAMRTTAVVKLEVPRIPAFWATIMGNDLDLSIDD